MNKKFAALIVASAALLPTSAAGAAEASRRPAINDVPRAGRQLLDLVNRERKTAGLIPLAARGDVAAIAGPWTRHMAADGRLGHNDSYLSGPTMDRIGAACIGENVAWAFSLIEAHQSLMASPRHRNNILNANFRQVGIAVVRAADDKLYVTEDFMAPRVPVSPTAAPSGRPSPQRPRPHPAGEARSKWRPYQRPPGRRPRCRAAF